MTGTDDLREALGNVLNSQQFGNRTLHELQIKEICDAIVPVIVDRLCGVTAERDQAVANMNDESDNDGLATAGDEGLFRTFLERATREHKTNNDRVNPSKKSKP